MKKILSLILKAKSKKMNPLEMHVAGATVQHSGPFSDLDVPIRTEPLTTHIKDKWVVPIYYGFTHKSAVQYVEQHIHEADKKLVELLLGQFDWRPRTVGANLAAILHLTELEEQIGRLLLRSDVCYAGDAYCVAIASFNTATGLAFLNQYLAYYLKKPELYFDQDSAMAALAYLDEKNGTSFIEQHMASWNMYVKDKEGWDLAAKIQRFKSYMEIVEDLKKQVK